MRKRIDTVGRRKGRANTLFTSACVPDAPKPRGSYLSRRRSYFIRGQILITHRVPTPTKFSRNRITFCNTRIIYRIGGFRFPYLFLPLNNKWSFFYRNFFNACVEKIKLLNLFVISIRVIFKFRSTVLTNYSSPTVS